MPPTEIPIRPPVTNAGWDPAVMLAKAEAGAYPTAASTRPSREYAGLTEAEAEVAYWRQRCGLPADLADAADAETGAAHHGHDAALDAAFLELPRARQRAIVRSYLMASLDVDLERGAHLCGLAGLDLAAERRAAAQEAARRLARCQERLRTTPSRRERGAAGQEVITW